MEAQAHPCRLLACLRCAGACRAATHGTSRRVPPASTSWLTHLRSGRGSADSSLTPAWTPGKQQLTAKGQDRGQSTGRTASGREQACRCPRLWSHACLHSHHHPPGCPGLAFACRDVRDTYLPAFRACVTEARASSVMCAYNAVNGTPACASDWLLQEVLRGDMGFRCGSQSCCWCRCCSCCWPALPVMRANSQRQLCCESALPAAQPAPPFAPWIILRRGFVVSDCGAVQSITSERAGPVRARTPCPAQAGSSRARWGSSLPEPCD